MATDLIASIQRFLTPELIGRMADGLGYDRTTIGKAVAAGVPGILATLAGVANNPDGAQKIANVVRQSSVSLDEIKDSLGSRTEQKSLADHGASVLSTLLGSGTMKTLSSAISEYAGLGDGAGKSLLGLLVPLVLGVIGGKQRAVGLDANGIANLLAGQKDAIGAALPTGFARQLSGTGILDSIGSAWKGGTAAASDTAARAREGVRTVYSDTVPPLTEPSGTGFGSWAVAALAAAFVIGMFWLFSGPGTEQVAQQDRPVTTPAPTTEGRAVATPPQDSRQITLQVTTTVDSLRSALQTMADVKATGTALPRLRDAAANLDQLSALAAQVPTAVKQQIAGQVAAALPQINQLCDRVLADPATAEAARPMIEPIRAKLAALAAS
jgi:hypothetical protein